MVLTHGIHMECNLFKRGNSTSIDPSLLWIKYRDMQTNIE